jgi:superoxide dismutase
MKPSSNSPWTIRNSSRRRLLQAASGAGSRLAPPPLPFAADALEPVIFAETLGFHHGRHHRGYFDELAQLTADTSLILELTPPLTVDVWDHAYDLQYQNRRADYLGRLIGRLLNWEFAAANFSSR